MIPRGTLKNMRSKSNWIKIIKNLNVSTFCRLDENLTNLFIS